MVNAIDDHLAKGSQIEVPWILRHIPVLEQLLSPVGEAGRTVVLTSDHGHIIEWESSYRGADSGERYRSNDGDPLEGELIVRGSRVIQSLKITRSLLRGRKVFGTRRRNMAITEAFHHRNVWFLLRFFPDGEDIVGGWQPQPTFYPEWWDVGVEPLYLAALI